MEVEIIINGISRTYRGYYEELHARNWNERVRSQLDVANEYEDGE